jgi:hypothetical protein
MKYKQARPKSLRVMGRDYEVNFEKELVLKSPSAGQCDNQKMIITILEEQHPSEELDTVVHELMHAIWHHMSMSEHPPEEEVLVRKMAGGLTQVILDNQQFSRYISAVYDEQIKRNFK